jgi:hypothetical protein
MALLMENGAYYVLQIGHEGAGMVCGVKREVYSKTMHSNSYTQHRVSYYEFNNQSVLFIDLAAGLIMKFRSSWFIAFSSKHP